MVEAWIYSLTAVVVVSVVSFVGVLSVFFSQKFLNRILIYLVSFSAGALFGGAFLHLLPEAVEESGFTFDVSLYILGGIIFFFVLEKFICWRHCHHPTTKDHPHPFAFMNLVGDVFHNFIDGLLIGATFLVDTHLGIATTLAVILHEVPQEIGDFGVLVHGGFSRGKALLLNFAVALTSVLGAVVALVIGSESHELTHFLVPFAAGGFIYIAGSDLIPELHKQTGNWKAFWQLMSILLGVGLMYGLTLLEFGAH